MKSTTTPRNGVALGDLQAGESALIHRLNGGGHFVRRLASLGFTPGARLKVIQNYGHGPLIVNLRDTRMALGRGEAEKILVRRLAEGDDG